MAMPLLENVTIMVTYENHLQILCICRYPPVFIHLWEMIATGKHFEKT